MTRHPCPVGPFRPWINAARRPESAQFPQSPCQQPPLTQLVRTTSVRHPISPGKEIRHISGRLKTLASARGVKGVIADERPAEIRRGSGPRSEVAIPGDSRRDRRGRPAGDREPDVRPGPRGRAARGRAGRVLRRGPRDRLRVGDRRPAPAPDGAGRSGPATR